MSESSIEQLILLKNGDMSAFDFIYHKYSQKLYGYVLRYLKTKEDAEEIVQEVFLKIWETRDKINPYASFDSYLFVIAYNSTISLLRKRVTETKFQDYIALHQENNEEMTALDELQFAELNEKVEGVISRLTERQREIYFLSREEGLSHKEIAEKLNLSENTVKNHLVTTLKFLRVNLRMNLLFCLFILTKY